VNFLHHFFAGLDVQYNFLSAIISLPQPDLIYNTGVATNTQVGADTAGEFNFGAVTGVVLFNHRLRFWVGYNYYHILAFSLANSDTQNFLGASNLTQYANPKAQVSFLGFGFKAGASLRVVKDLAINIEGLLFNYTAFELNGLRTTQYNAALGSVLEKASTMSSFEVLISASLPLTFRFDF
jgi:hypothetical protein